MPDGVGCIVRRSPVRRQPEQMRCQLPPKNTLADRRMAGRHSSRMVRGLCFGGRPVFRLASATIFAATVHLRRSLADCAFRFGNPMRAVWRIASIAPTLNARIHTCQISLRPIARTALTHGLVNGFGWQGTATPLAPCCNGAAQSFFPWACHPIATRWGPRRRPFLARQETPVCTVLHFVAALRVQQRKPLP